MSVHGSLNKLLVLGQDCIRELWELMVSVCPYMSIRFPRNVTVYNGIHLIEMC